MKLCRFVRMMIRVQGLVWLGFLASQTAWAAQHSQVSASLVAHGPKFQSPSPSIKVAHSPTKALWAGRLPVPPIPPVIAQRMKPAPVSVLSPPPSPNITSGQKMPAPPMPLVHAPWQELAPIPDRDATPPVSRDSSSFVNVNVTDFRTTAIQTSAGFAGGSQYRSAEDLRSIQAPGVKLAVPLQLP
jgi:hypothetical protein